MIVEYIIDQFLLTECHKKRNEQGYDISKESLSKWNYQFYFSLMKCFGFIDVNRTVWSMLSALLTKSQTLMTVVGKFQFKTFWRQRPLNAAVFLDFWKTFFDRKHTSALTFIENSVPNTIQNTNKTKCYISSIKTFL